MGAFPYWFCENYQHFLGRTEALPVDGNLLLALIAPRPLYVGSAQSDPFSDPVGEFLAAQSVTPVYALYDEEGLPSGDPPIVNHSVGDFVGYHVRDGGHDVTAFDWKSYLDFADRHLPLRPRSPYSARSISSGARYRWQPNSRRSHADDQAIGQIYLGLHRELPDLQRIAPLRSQFDALRQVPDSAAKPVW